MMGDQNHLALPVKFWLASGPEEIRLQYDDKTVELARVPIVGDIIQFGGHSGRVSQVILYIKGDSPLNEVATVRVEFNGDKA